MEMFFFSRNVTSFLYNIHRHSVIRSLPETLRMNKTVHIWAFKTATGSLVFCILLVTEQEYIYIYIYDYTIYYWNTSKMRAICHTRACKFFSFFFITLHFCYTLENVFSAFLPFLLSFCFPFIFRWVHLPVPKLELQEMHGRGNIFVLKNQIDF